MTKITTLPPSENEGLSSWVLPPSNHDDITTSSSMTIDDNDNLTISTPLLQPPAHPHTVTPFFQPYYETRVTSLLRLLVILLSFLPLIPFIIGLLPPIKIGTGIQNPPYDPGYNKIVITGLVLVIVLITWNLAACLGVGRRLLGGRGKLVGGLLEVVFCIFGNFGFVSWARGLGWGEHRFFPDEMDLWVLVGILQIVVAFISLWSKTTDSRLAWVKLIYEDETTARHFNILSTEPTPLPTHQQTNPLIITAEMIEPPSVITPRPSSEPPKSYTLTLRSIILRALILLLSIILFYALDPYYHSLSQAQVQLRLIAAYSLATIIIYFRAKHQPHPSHLLKFVFKKEDIENARRVKGKEVFGGEGPFLTDRGRKALRKTLYVVDLVATFYEAFVTWDLLADRWTPGLRFGFVGFLQIVLVVLLLIVAFDITWKDIVGVYRVVRNRVGVFVRDVLTDPEARPFEPPEQIYRDVENDAGVDEDSEMEEESVAAAASLI